MMEKQVALFKKNGWLLVHKYLALQRHTIAKHLMKEEQVVIKPKTITNTQMTFKRGTLEELQQLTFQGCQFIGWR